MPTPRKMGSKARKPRAKAAAARAKTAARSKPYHVAASTLVTILAIMGAILWATGVISPGVGEQQAFLKNCRGNSCHVTTVATTVTTPSTTVATTTVATTPSPVGWVPAPPTSYSSTGIVSYSKIGDVAGTTPGYSSFFTLRQHGVHNQYGDFVAYTYEDTGHNPAYWRLKRSTDGTTWTTIYDSKTAGDPSYVTAPSVETDVVGNVYVIANYHPTDNLHPKLTVFYKFAAATGFTSSTIATINKSSGKYATVLDQSRNWIWLLYWQESAEANLWAVDLTGKVVYQRQIFPNITIYPGWVDPNTNAQAHYPALTVGRDGTLVLAWTTSDNHIGVNPPGIQNYYDIHFVYSKDGGQSFIGASGAAVTLPVTVDDSGTQANSGYQVVDTADPNEFIKRGSPGYYDIATGLGKWNWNLVSSIAVNHGDIHFHNESNNAAQVYPHDVYTRFDMATGRIDKRISPHFVTNDGFQMGTNHGSFVQDTTGANRLYYVGAGYSGDRGRLQVFGSDDGGTTWYRYALGPPIPGAETNALLYVNAFRWVNTDGSIVGSFSLGLAPNSVYFYRVAPS